jgi:hypothetical protein
MFLAEFSHKKAQKSQKNGGWPARHTRIYSQTQENQELGAANIGDGAVSHSQSRESGKNTIIGQEGLRGQLL